MELIPTFIMITGGVAIVVTFLANLGKLIKYVKSFFLRIEKKVAMRLHALVQNDCSAVKTIKENSETLNEVILELRQMKKINLRTLGDAINRKCRFHVGQGFATFDEKQQLLAEFTDYYDSNGNGDVFSNTCFAMRLPTVLGGAPVECDLNQLMEVRKREHGILGEKT